MSEAYSPPMARAKFASRPFPTLRGRNANFTSATDRRQE